MKGIKKLSTLSQFRSPESFRKLSSFSQARMFIVMVFDTKGFFLSLVYNSQWAYLIEDRNGIKVQAEKSPAIWAPFC